MTIGEQDAAGNIRNRHAGDGKMSPLLLYNGHALRQPRGIPRRVLGRRGTRRLLQGPRLTGVPPARPATHGPRDGRGVTGWSSEDP